MAESKGRSDKLLVSDFRTGVGVYERDSVGN